MAVLMSWISKRSKSQVIHPGRPLVTGLVRVRCLDDSNEPEVSRLRLRWLINSVVFRYLTTSSRLCVSDVVASGDGVDAGFAPFFQSATS